MKRAGFAAGAVLMVALLAGCSAPAVDEPIASAAPLVAESPAAQTEGDSEAAYLDAVREALPANTQIPDATDEQLLDVGLLACQQIDEGVDTSTASLIEGERDNGYGAYLDSGAIFSAAVATLCLR